MAECQNFFDDKSPSVCKSSSSMEQLSSPASTTADGNTTEGDDHRLDLCLGPSVDVNKPIKQQHEMVRPIPLYPYLDKQRSGNYANASGSSALFRGRSDASMAEKAMFSKDSAFSTPAPLISREQVWQSLQNTNAVLRKPESRASKALCDDAASSMLGRRSTSMQIVLPTNELSEAGACQIRRSCSNGIQQGLLSRESSVGQEALVDESPDTENSVAFHHQQDALELQKKKEMQALRRLEARKRRRILIDKHQKKARQNSGLSNRQSTSPVEKAPLARMRSVDCKYTLEPLHEAKAATLMDDEDMKSRKQVKVAHIGETSPSSCKVEGGRLENFCFANDEMVNLNKAIHKQNANTRSGSKRTQSDLSSVQQMIASCDLSAHTGLKDDHLSVQAGKDSEMCDVGKIPHSSWSETESSETKEKEVDFSERESSSQKSSTENYFDYGISANAIPSSSKPMLYPRTPPCTPSGSTKTQVNSSFQCSTPLPSTSISRNEGFHGRHLASSQPKVSELLSEVPSNLTIKRSVGVFFEGKWRIPDEGSVSPPIRRTASNINQVLPESQCPAKKLETYVSLSASQMKFAGMVFNGAAGESVKRKRGEMQLILSSRVPSPEKGVKKELDYLALEEKPILGAKGPGRTEHTLAPHTVTTPIKVKQEEDVLEENLFENHFSSEHSRVVAPKVRVGGPIDRQMSESFADLPWVTTTGRGPNGRTVNGVMYIASGRSVRLVCRCHGKHMSPAEFVEHAGSTDLSNPLKNIVGTFSQSLSEMDVLRRSKSFVFFLQEFLSTETLKDM